jgi:hypothetical protein
MKILIFLASLILCALWGALSVGWFSGMTVVANIVGGYKWIEHMGVVRTIALSAFMGTLCISAAIAVLVLQRLPTPLALVIAIVGTLHLLSGLGLYLSSNTNQRIWMSLLTFSGFFPATTRYVGMPPGNDPLLLLPCVTMVTLFFSYFLRRRNSEATEANSLVSMDLTSNDVERKSQKKLWNPTAAASWSILFTPIFGAFLQMKNWRSLGEYQKASESRDWFYASIFYLLALSFISLLLSSPKDLGLMLWALQVIILITWFISSGRMQNKYIKDLGISTYARRGWLWPLLIAAALYVSLHPIFKMLTPILASAIRKI